MMKGFDRNDTILYKFVVYQIKRMVCDSDGDPIYMEAFDRVFYDLYGIEDFSRRLSRMYNNRNMQKLINKVGLGQLIKLFKNPSYCNILHDMVMMSNDLKLLKKRIDKNRRKGNGKITRYDVKEFNDVIKLYNKSVKALRKSLKVKNIHKAYKDKYKVVRNFVGQNGQNDLYWDDIDFGDILDEDEDGDDIFDDDFDPDESTILEDFARALNGKSTSRSKKSSRKRKSFDYDDEEDEIYYEEDDAIENLQSKVDRLCNHMQSLSDTVQGLAAQNRYNDINNRSEPRRQSHSSRTVAVPSDNKLANDIADIKDCIVSMSQTVGGLNERMNDLESLLDDDDDYVNDTGHVNQFVQNRLAEMNQGQIQPVQNNRDAAAIIDALNNAPDVTPEMLEKIVANNQD